MTVATIGDRILEELIFRGPLTVEELSEALKIQPAFVRRGLALLYEQGKIRGQGKSTKIERVTHG